MATVSKLIAALLALEKEDSDKRKVFVVTPDGAAFKLVKIEEGVWQGHKGVILRTKEQDD